MKRWLLLLVLLTPMALGHAVPYESEPGAGGRLSESPEFIVVRFTEPVHEEGTWIRLYNGAGEQLDNDDLSFEFGSRPTLTITVPELPDAPYRIQWQTYSQTDGHVIGGSIGFAIGSFAPPTTESGDADTASVIAVVARMLQYVSYALGAGALLAVFLGWAGPTRNALLSSGAGNVLAHVLLLLDNTNATGLGSAYIQSAGGLDLLLRAVGWIAFLMLLWRPRFFLVAFAWLLLALYDARFGHASQQGAWAIGAEFVHLVAVSLWVGGLVWFVRYGKLEQGRDFGRVALWSVIALTLSGFALSVGVLGSDLFRLTESTWGTLLMVKLILVATMLFLATLNRFVVLGTDEDPGKWLRRRFGAKNWSLKRVAGTEAVLGVITLLVAGGLLSVGAPSAGLVASFSDDLQGFDLSGTIQITPAPVAGSEHQLRLYLVETESTEPMRNNTCGRDAGCVRISWFADAEGELTSQEVELEPEGDGWWTGQMIFFASGDHTIRVDATTAWLHEELIGTVRVS